MENSIKEIRNIAIIAHVDHGKTTLLDGMLEYSKMSKGNFTMDSNAIEQERGITIYAKNTSIIYKGNKINVLDTPGHADFGSEVERVLRAVDSVLLLVDAKEGPMPQTRFVLKKALSLGLDPIVIINKIDKPAARPNEVYDEVLELFIELGAQDHQINFPVLYAVGRDGLAKKNLADEWGDFSVILDEIVKDVKIASDKIDAPFQAQVFNLAYDSYLGRMAIARVYSGKVSDGTNIYSIKNDGSNKQNKIVKMFTFVGTEKIAISEATCGDIVMIAGMPEAYIGDTLVKDLSVPKMDSISIDEPTVKVTLMVNDSPFAGKSGKFLTSREINERLEKETEVNVGLIINPRGDSSFEVMGRGELHLSVLFETMRREGFEFQVSPPEAVFKKDAEGKVTEPYEEVIIEAPMASSGTVIDKLTKRKGQIVNLAEDGSMMKISMNIPTRGLLGYRNEFIIDTKGEGIIAARFLDYGKYVGEIKRKEYGSMISMENGKALSFALWNLQERGRLYIGHATEVYNGMVIGNTSNGEQMVVNPTKGKQLTNMRASGTDEAVKLEPFIKIDIEKGLEIMSDDEYLEITPDAIRIRKKYLTEQERSKNKRIVNI